MTRSDRLGGALVQAAPLLGFPVWLVTLYATGNNYAVLVWYFMPGLFLLGTALVVAAAVTLLSRPGFVRTQAAGSLRFHGIAAAMVAGLAGVFALVIVLSPMPQGELDPNRGPMLGIFGLATLLFGTALTLVEIARALIYAWKAASAQSKPAVPEG